MDTLNCQTAGYGMDFPFEHYERMTDYMRRCRGGLRPHQERSTFKKRPVKLCATGADPDAETRVYAINCIYT